MADPQQPAASLSVEACHVCRSGQNHNIHDAQQTRFELVPCSLLLPCADSQCGTGLPLTPPFTCKDISSSCPQALRDYQALMVWKSALQDPAGKLTSWQGIEPCSTTQPWAGVACSEDGFAVVAVNVSGFGLIGPPPSVQSMAQLTVSSCQLQPQQSMLYASPSQLVCAWLDALVASRHSTMVIAPHHLHRAGCLASQILDISNNSLSGSLPAEWGSLQQLSHLNVSYNRLNGTLPESWATMSSLLVLDASKNTLQVSCPAYCICLLGTITRDGTKSSHDWFGCLHVSAALAKHGAWHLHQSTPCNTCHTISRCWVCHDQCSRLVVLLVCLCPLTFFMQAYLVVWFDRACDAFPVAA